MSYVCTTAGHSTLQTLHVYVHALVMLLAAMVILAWQEVPLSSGRRCTGGEGGGGYRIISSPGPIFQGRLLRDQLILFWSERQIIEIDDFGEIFLTPTASYYLLLLLPEGVLLSVLLSSSRRQTAVGEATRVRRLLIRAMQQYLFRRMSYRRSALPAVDRLGYNRAVESSYAPPVWARFSSKISQSQP